MIEKFVEKAERVVIIVLLVTLLFIICYTTFVFIKLLFEGFTEGLTQGSGAGNIFQHLHAIFGGFLSVLIGIELLHTIKMYLRTDVVHVEVVLLVALTGVSRHVIDLDYEKLDPMKVLGLAALIISLSAGYYLIKKGMVSFREKKMHKK